MNNQLLKLIFALDKLPLTTNERAEYQAILQKTSEVIDNQNKQIEALKEKIELLENA